MSQNNNKLTASNLHMVVMEDGLKIVLDIQRNMVLLLEKLTNTMEIPTTVNTMVEILRSLIMNTIKCPAKN